MKKTLAILMAIMMVFALSGCGTTKEVLSHPARTTAEETTFTTSAIESIAESIEPEITEDVSSETNDTKPIWPTTHWLSELLPHPDYITEVKVINDKPSDFQADVSNLTPEDFGDYKYQLVVCGWDTVLTSDDEMFIADHEDGIHRVVVQPNCLDKDITYIHIWEAH